ncbi:cysteine synthase A [Campylobacter sp. MG1]|uniref:cysteine synthase A n=1 Tax=Campylobacter sp. MG1 TaxID=2976332 RepID=UPI00226CE221|nr:cysteine synthase A [Campylobacter sp. MG1]
MIYNNVLELIGNTPVVRLNNMVDDDMAQVYLKLERFNITGSVKDRAALAMIIDAKNSGKLKNNSIILEPTSGNTGIALAMIGKLMGYEVCIVMPETMSKERRDLIAAYGAKLVLTEGKLGMSGAIQKANELANSDDRYFIPQQFNNFANSNTHYNNTAEEIINDFSKLDAFVAGVGTGGTISGVGKKLKEKFNNIKIIAVEPESSPVLSGGKAAPHKIQGIGAGFIPTIYDANVVDCVEKVSNEDAFYYAKLLAQKEGILAGISTGANVKIALELAKKLGKGKVVLSISPDSGEKYISTGIYDV